MCIGKIIFFISHPKHMLWVLKKTVSMKQFFIEHPKHMFKLKENNYNFTLIKFPYLDLWRCCKCSSETCLMHEAVLMGTYNIVYIKSIIKACLPGFSDSEFITYALKNYGKNTGIMPYLARKYATRK